MKSHSTNVTHAKRIGDDKAARAEPRSRKNGGKATRKSGTGTLKRKVYERQLARLHGELVALQQ